MQPGARQAARGTRPAHEEEADGVGA